MKAFPIAALAAAVIAGAAHAQIHLPPEVTDGMYITVDEVRANATKTFNAVAGAGDDGIAKQRFMSMNLPEDVMPNRPNGPLLDKLFERLDADGNDRLTRAEWNQRLERDISFADQNEDGRITLKELANARANMSVGDALGMVF